MDEPVVTLSDLAALVNNAEALSVLNVGNPNACREMIESMTDYQIGQFLRAIDSTVQTCKILGRLRLQFPNR